PFLFSLPGPPPPRTYTLSLHDALPIYARGGLGRGKIVKLPAFFRSGRDHQAALGLQFRVGPELVAQPPPQPDRQLRQLQLGAGLDRKSTRLNSSHLVISYAVFCLKKKT